MSPSRSTHDARDCYLVNAVFGTEFALQDNASRVTGANRDHIGFGQSRVWMRLAFEVWKALASFRHHISNIVAVGPDKQVLRIAARRMVATMTNLHAFCDWALCQFPRKPMRVIFVSANTERTVAQRRFVSSPYPAFAGLIDESPHVLVTICGRVFRALTRTVAPESLRVFSDVPFAGPEAYSALHTRARNCVLTGTNSAHWYSYFITTLTHQETQWRHTTSI